ncbi:hypothetical protein TI05_01880 [Achromatium sp. WMS3]|nr:hypothetical protein TI05_01880 [Achromatium sp. WMS3]
MKYLRDKFLELIRFGLISGVGLLGDLTIFHFLVHSAKWPIIIANLTSAFCAITFVFITSSCTLFQKQGFYWIDYVSWIFYQICSIVFFSWLIKMIVFLSRLEPTISKITTIPFSFITNYLFLAWLIQRGNSYRMR